ncbi:hypothetical protein SEUCBS139899_007016 [Sporothrix eucalyptigena]
MGRSPSYVLPSVKVDTESPVAGWLDSIPDRQEYEAVPEPEPYSEDIFLAQRNMQTNGAKAERKHDAKDEDEENDIDNDGYSNGHESKRLRGPLLQRPGARAPAARSTVIQAAPVHVQRRPLPVIPVADDDNLAEHAYYRDLSLNRNNMYILSGYCPQLPPQALGVVMRIQDSADVSLDIDGGLPVPSLNSLARDPLLQAMPHGTKLPEVAWYFENKIFWAPTVDSGLERTTDVPMARRTLPDLLPVRNTDIAVPAGRYPMNAIATPKPSILYGYSLDMSFPHRRHRTQLHRLSLTAAASRDADGGGTMWLPFFSVEFLGESSGGSLKTATNRCMVNSATCVHMVETLKARLPEDVCINSTAFSVAISGTEARLYVTWAEKAKSTTSGTANSGRPSYYMATIGTYVMQRPEDFVEVRRMFLRILDWARGPRLDAIRSGLSELADGSEGPGPGEEDQKE